MSVSYYPELAITFEEPTGRAPTSDRTLPQFIRDLIGSPPAAGSGVHGWLFKLARQLHAHRDEQEIIDLLSAAVDGCGRHVPHAEIVAAVADARDCAWQPDGAAMPSATKAKPKWPAVDQAKRQAAIEADGVGLADMRGESPYSTDELDAEGFVDALFPGDPLLCCGRDMRTFTTAPRESLRGRLVELALIVPSPMSALTGHRKSDGEESAHTLENTGPRHYLVTEFDTGTPDEQAATIWHLRQFAPLVLVVTSGGKSLHAWFDCRGIAEGAVERFFRYAVTLGADPATWTRSQFVRLPGGWRHDKGTRQEVQYFSPSQRPPSASDWTAPPIDVVPELTRAEPPVDSDPIPDTTGKRGETLRQRAYALRFNPAEEPPPDETCMLLGDFPLAARGNLTAIQGKSKVGKSAVVAAMLGAVQRGVYQLPGDTLALSWLEDSRGAIIHFDSEQSRSDWHALVRRSVTRSGLEDPSPRLVSIPLVQFSRLERMAILEATLEHEMSNRGAIDLVMIDGVADLCTSPNDEAESLDLITKLMGLADRFKCAIVCVLHENPSAEGGKTRGHLGSELNRKAFANLRIDKDAETSISTMWGLDFRKRDIPQNQGFCFAWSDEAKMHVFRGRAGGVKTAQRDAKATAKAREEWEPIFEHAAENGLGVTVIAEIGTNLTCPALNAERAAEIERDISGTKKLTTYAAMKKRMQRAESLGVLRRMTAGIWTLATAGQAGQERDK